jgi:hypothetical protein
METDAGDGEKGDLMCVWEFDSYGVEIGRVVQATLIAMIMIAIRTGDRRRLLSEEKRIPVRSPNCHRTENAGHAAF